MKHQSRGNAFIAGFFVISFLLVIASELGFVRGEGNIILALLITFSFFLDIPELAMLVAVSAFFVNWQPMLSPELALFVTLPFFARWARKFLPLELWLDNLALVLIATAVLYCYEILTSPITRTAYGNLRLWLWAGGQFLWAVAPGLAVAALFFWIFDRRFLIHHGN